MTKSQAMAECSKQWGSANSEWASAPKQTIIYTTFVETDSDGFRELVQKLTGVSEGEKMPVTMPARNSRKGGALAAVGAGVKTDSCDMIKGGVEVGIQKSGFKLHQRRQFQKKIETKRSFYHELHKPTRLTGNNNDVSLSPVTPKALIPSPITPLEPADPFNSSPSCCYSSTPTSGNQSSYLEEEEQGFYFEASAISVKREPELLPLFPLHSPTQPRST
ncbi:hypothetical protein SUGI_0324620 [Cryptomeria japonica]|uniref:VQ motif-containing protein 4 n=1 Tax=Cryptomeria japonica TaxID=3369 RepID=UPI002408F12E|nr:VQ motif-containing protein 4 [Cryptomeria japonica]GLJ18339.1 hypothetical protein SUGI_0324620 [Cryptomeria japonica]